MNLRPKPSPPPELNLTPLVDVVFLLLLFFMVSTTFTAKRELPIRLPEAQGRPGTASEERALVVVIDRQSQYVIDEQPLTIAAGEDVTQALTRVLSNHPQGRALRIEADAATPHQAVMRVLDAAQALGLTRLAFSTQRPPAAPPAPETDMP